MKNPTLTAPTDAPNLAHQARTASLEIIGDFRAWVISERQEAEIRLSNLRRDEGEQFPLAQLALGHVEPPDDTMLAVLIEFARIGIERRECEDELAQLNAYYIQAVEPRCEETLNVEQGGGHTFARLWSKYLNRENKADDWH